MPTSGSGCHMAPRDEPCLFGVSSWGLCAPGLCWCHQGSCWDRQGTAQGQPVLTELVDLRVTAPYRLEGHQGSGERERGKEQWSHTSAQDLLPWVLSGAGPGWGWVVGPGCFWLWVVAACPLL